MPRAAIDLVILTASSIEALAVRQIQKQPLREIPCGRSTATLSHLGPYTCVTLSAGGGKKRIKSAYTSLFEMFEPRVFVNFGAAGGLNPDWPIGTITVPREIVSYTWPDLRPQGDPLVCEVEELRKAVPEIRISRAGSCPHDIRDAEIRKQLHRDLGLDTTDWETWRIARAAQLAEIPFIALRCITDRADEHAGTDYSRNVRAVLNRGAAALQKLAQAILGRPE
ncbi:hypothetical protein HQ520_11570 [bacterium]|nr:hypothetical protein [bacterium]